MQHFQHLLSLLKLEWEEDFKIYQQKVQQASINERRKAGFAWYPIKINNWEISTGGKLYVTLERNSQATENHVFQNGSPVGLFANIEGEKQRPIEAGVVAWVRQNMMKIVLSAEELPDWIDDGKLGVEVLFDDKTYREQENAIKEVIKADKNRLAALRNVLIGEENALFDKMPAYLQLPNLNQKQNEAIQKVLAAKDVAFIHGPPGTGKTTTLTEAIALCLKTEKQVLVTAASNTAVDLLTEKLAAKGLRVLRLGNPARIDDSLLVYSLDEQIAKHPQFKDLKKMRKDAENYKQIAHKYKRSFGAGEREQRKLLLQEAKNILKDAEKTEAYILDSLLQNTQVITATLTGTTAYVLKNKIFSTVFIDEAAQALEPACWLAILKAEKVVMAGDHCQLPPTVKSAEAAKLGLSKTLFEQTIEKQHKLGNQADVMLEVQYRMHKEIMEFSNQQFYQGKLQAHASVATKRLGEDAQNNFLYQPFEWIDTAGCGFAEERDKESASLYNSEEAQLLIKHLTILVENLQTENAADRLQNLTIGIVSPYKAQVKLLNELLQATPFATITEANTVDGFQGQERNIIYISLVRCNEEGEIGFLKDTRRMNVAMTRAKQKLVIFGDSATLSAMPFYEKLLSYADSIQAYKTAWEFMG